MRTFPTTEIGADKSLSLVASLNQDHDHVCTRRAVELESRIARLRSELEEAEAELEREITRVPTPGDFVRCPLTNFFGRVTKITPRPQGRAWVEIIPYLGPHLPGHSTMDLFDSWELIDPPSDETGAQGALGGSSDLPAIAPFMLANRPEREPAPAEDDIEASLRRLWSPSGTMTS